MSLDAIGVVIHENRGEGFVDDRFICFVGWVEKEVLAPVNLPVTLVITFINASMYII